MYVIVILWYQNFIHMLIMSSVLWKYIICHYTTYYKHTFYTTKLKYHYECCTIKYSISDWVEWQIQHETSYNMSMQCFYWIVVFVWKDWLSMLWTWVWENGFIKMLHRLTEPVVSLLLLPNCLEMNDTRVLDINWFPVM